MDVDVMSCTHFGNTLDICSYVNLGPNKYSQNDYPELSERIV